MCESEEAFVILRSMTNHKSTTLREGKVQSNAKRFPLKTHTQENKFNGLSFYWLQFKRIVKFLAQTAATFMSPE